MGWYFGTDQQITLQEKVDELTVWCKDTKGAVNGGRFLGTDNIDALGWSKILGFLKDGGVFTFRMVSVEKIEELQFELNKHGMRFDSWNVFSADSNTIEKHTNHFVDLRLPDEYSLIDTEELADAAVIYKIQECMARNGVAPYSGRLLSGQSLPSVTIAVRDRDANVIATAFGYFPYNQYSKWSSTAWGGLVAVDESHRGMKLGVQVNAIMVRCCVDRLGAKEVQEFAAATNIPSRKMIERSGLELDPDVVSGIASAGSSRFTT